MFVPQPATPLRLERGGLRLPALFEASVHDPSVLRAVFMLGAGGSGKGRIYSEMFAGRGLRYVNQDNHLERMLQQHDIPLSKAGSNYGIFKAAQGLARKERDSLAKQRVGLAIDMTGWDLSRVAKPVEMLRDLGYDVYAVIVVTELQTALDRNRQRAKDGGRKVPSGYVRSAWAGVRKNLPRYVTLFGKSNTFIIDNDKPHDPEFWATTIAPALTRLGDKILARPLRNPKGKTWMKGQHRRIAKQAKALQQQSPDEDILPSVSLPRMSEFTEFR